jgi:lipopolysaccharide/colanic/teichoic acid biosynthesis glycosyltransferase
VPRLYERTQATRTVRHLGDVALLDVRRSGPSALQLRLKRIVDLVVAAIALVLLAPAMLAALAAVWLTMGRPIFFRQTRVTRGERTFGMLKFRTMRNGLLHEVVDLPPDTAPGGVEGGIDRTTRVGRFLRRTSIDELPQLLNVLAGDMSLVGPRPERPEFVRRFNATVPGYGRRHRMAAGITGWAQVNGLRGQTSISERVAWDNHYIDGFSLWFDLKILVLTPIVAFCDARVTSGGRPQAP